MFSRNDVRIVLIVLSTILLTVFLASWSAQTRIRAWQAEFMSGEQPSHVAASLLLEHHRFTATLWRFVHADEVSRAELQDRFDIYWSRYLLTETQRERFADPTSSFAFNPVTLNSHSLALKTLLSTLVSGYPSRMTVLEQRLQALQPGDMAALRDIRRLLLPAGEQISQLLVYAFERERYLDQLQVQLSEQLRRLLWTTFVSLGLVLALASLVVLVYVRQKHIAARQLKQMNLKLVAEVRESERLANELEHRATHDMLSGLTNRLGFTMELNNLLEAGRGTHGLCFVDLDMFKIVNDTCGHAAGDQLIETVSQRLRQRMPHSATVARFGGDEFLLLVPDCDPDQFRELVEVCCADLRPLVFRCDDKRFEVTGSFGAAVFDAADHNSESLMAVVDSACYEAKRAGGARVVMHNDNDCALAERHNELQWVSYLQTALSEDRFQLYQQEIYALNGDTGKRKCEILLRLQDQQGRLVAPGEFLEIAERYSLATRIDYWVISKVFEWLNNPHNAGLFDTVNINLSGLSVGDRDMLSFIERQTLDLQVDARQVCFEITESAVVGQHAHEFLERLKELGYQLALDDFGAGFSSFGYLESLPVDYIKIDGLFVRDIDSNATHREFVKAISAVGQAMGKYTVAEFVENEQALDILRELNLDFAQGYHIARPAPLWDERGAERKAA